MIGRQNTVYKKSYFFYVLQDGCGEEALSIQTLRHCSVLMSGDDKNRKVREEPKTRNGDPAAADSSGDGKGGFTVKYYFQFMN